MLHRLGLTSKLSLTSLAVLILAGCAKDNFVSADSGPWPDGVTDMLESCSGNVQRCLANTLQSCRNSRWADINQCNSGEVCSQRLKRCSQCEPGERFCVSGAVYDCNADGAAGTKIKACPDGKCSSGHCDDPCSIAEASRSYVGCNYYPTVTVNSMLAADFTFSVAVANAHSQPATVTVSTNANPKVATATVAPNSLTTINLPWVDSLRQKGETTVESVLAVGGGYHLQSTLPVTVYQFNALDYVLPHDCNDPADEPGPEDIGDNKCYSYTNDASLLLPENALSFEYMIITRPTHGLKQGTWPFSSVSGSPGFFSVVGVKEGQTEVRVTFAGNTQAGSKGLAAYKAGDAGVFKLGQGDVLEIVSESPGDCTPAKSDSKYGYCDFSKTTDLTGTGITADRDIAVFAGHNCTFVPFDKWACDHLEEQMFPLKSWGKRYVASHTDSSGKDPNLYRVISAEDGNQITFSPAVNAPVTLARGRYIEFVSDQDFEVKGSARFALAQFMVGQSYSSAAGEGAPGDPSMALAVPVEQYRTSYRFLAPSSYQQNYVNLIAPEKTTAKLDGNAVDEGYFKVIGTTGYKVAKLKIAGGSHLVESSGAVGIMVYGVGSYTSYMYPGGLDLRLLE